MRGKLRSPRSADKPLRVPTAVLDLGLAVWDIDFFFFLV